MALLLSGTSVFTLSFQTRLISKYSFSDIQPEFSWCILPLKVGGGDELFFILMEEYDKIQSETLESRMDSGSYKTVLCEAIKMKRIEVVKRLWKWKQRCQLSARDIHGLLHQLVQHDE